MNKINEQLKKELHLSVIKSIYQTMKKISKEHHEITITDDLFYQSLKYAQEILKNELLFFED